MTTPYPSTAGACRTGQRITRTPITAGILPPMLEIDVVHHLSGGMVAFTGWDPTGEVVCGWEMPTDTPVMVTAELHDQHCSHLTVYTPAGGAR